MSSSFSSRIIYVVPTDESDGMTSVCLGLKRSLERVNVKAGIAKPIISSFSLDSKSEVYVHSDVPPLSVSKVEQCVSDSRSDELVESVADFCYATLKHNDLDVLIVEGVSDDDLHPYVNQVNALIADALDAVKLLLVVSYSLSDIERINAIRLLKKRYHEDFHLDFDALLINKLGRDTSRRAADSLNFCDTDDIGFREPITSLDHRVTISVCNLPCIAAVPWNPTIVAPLTSSVFEYLQGDIINIGENSERRVLDVVVCARTVGNLVSTMRAGTLIVTSGDREDVFTLSALAELNNTPLAGIVLSGGFRLTDEMKRFCQKAFRQGLPVIVVHQSTLQIIEKLMSMPRDLIPDDFERIEKTQNFIADNIDHKWLVKQLGMIKKQRLTPAAFKHGLLLKARADRKRIVLPEGEEIRTIEAAIMAQAKGVANCVLIGKKTEIEQSCESHGLILHPDIEVFDPETLDDKYVNAFIKAREKKKFSYDEGRQQLEDCVVLGTTMLYMGEVDGLVSGAVNTTANTVRPAFQLIKARPECELISSVFFMCLPEQVLVYGDCAINPDPTANQLADIAIQSGESAKAFGVDPKIAMISYSTGASGTGADVEKVKEATALVKELRPDLVVDGPLQYDAAFVADVGRNKAPNSPVAGQANVFIFPDLNTGNTTYKAVQRSANVVSIGPMLQGLNKPVNDLSRGALVDDIFYTIALTVIQAQQV